MRMTRRDALAGGLAATGSVLLVQNTTAQEQEAARAGTLELNTLDFTTAPNPVLFWNEVSLQMVAHDHSVDPGMRGRLDPARRREPLDLCMR